MQSKKGIFTARRYASAVYSVVMCPSVCPSVCLSQVGTVSKPLNTESRKQRHTIAQGLPFSDAKNFHKIRPGSTPTGAPNAGAVG